MPSKDFPLFKLSNNFRKGLGAKVCQETPFITRTSFVSAIDDNGLQLRRTRYHSDDPDDNERGYY
jgi:hypothetical protein